MLALNYKLEAEEAKEALRAAPEVLERHLSAAIEGVLALLHRQVHQNITSPYGPKPPAVAFGYLANAVTTEHPEPLFGRVGIAPPADVYAAPVEYGTRPHWPPRAPIERWVEKKFGPNLSAGEKKSIAFLVARKIAKKGTQGHLMFERAFEAQRERAEILLDQGVEEALKELSGAG